MKKKNKKKKTGRSVYVRDREASTIFEHLRVCGSGKKKISPMLLLDVTDEVTTHRIQIG